MNGIKRITGNVSLLEWLVLPFGLIAAINYSWIIDDAFIYFRYVDNLLFLNNGLVFNRGEYAEGFSSPLWCLLLIAFRATGLDFWVVVRLIAVLAFILFWFMAIHVNRQFSPKSVRYFNLPLLFLAFNYGVSSYFTSGLEAPLVLLSALLFALLVLNPNSLALQILLGLTPLARHELALPLLMILLWCWYKNKKFPWVLALSSSLITGAWLLFRVYYYAEFLPTTFYLKNLWQIEQGLYYLNNVLWPYKLYFLLPTAGLALWLLSKHGTTDGEKSPDLRIPERLFMLVLAAGITVYVIKIGGDSRHFRYLAFPFVLSVSACGGIVEHALRRLKLESYKSALVFAGILFAVYSFMLYPQQFFFHPTNRDMACEPLQKIKNKRLRPYANFIYYHKIGDAVNHRCQKTLVFNAHPWSGGWDLGMIGKYDTYTNENTPFVYQDVSHGNWCFTLYKQFQIRLVQNLGLTDAILSRMNIKESKPGHKLGLIKYAKQMVALIKKNGGTPGRGMHRTAVQEGRAPQWVERNLDSIELIEKKVYNRHDFTENIALAFSFPERIKP
jgi:hypothetical protein